jgi:hypothetical protein
VTPVAVRKYRPGRTSRMTNPPIESVVTSDSTVELLSARKTTVALSIPRPFSESATEPIIAPRLSPGMGVLWLGSAAGPKLINLGPAMLPVHGLLGAEWQEADVTMTPTERRPSFQDFIWRRLENSTKEALESPPGN